MRTKSLGKGGLLARNGLLLAAIFCLLALSFAAFASTPTIISLQGKLTNETTGAVIQNAPLTINISSTSGQTLWNETFSSGVSNGFFDLLLGSTAGNPLNLTYNQDYNISLSVGDQVQQIGGTYRFRSGVGLISPSNLSAGNFTAEGNFSFGSTTYIDQTNGRVGIGTTSPDQELEVEGNNIHLDGTNAYLQIDRNVNTNQHLLLFATDGTDEWSLGTKDSTDAIHFFEGNSAERFTIEAGGNVGIGNTDPNSTLDVSGTVNLDTLSFNDGTSATGLSEIGNVTNNNQLANGAGYLTSVGDTDITAGAVDGGSGGEIADGTVDENDLASDSVQDSELDYSAVTLSDFTNDRGDLFDLGNYSAEYASSGYKTANVTSDFPNLDTDRTDDYNDDNLTSDYPNLDTDSTNDLTRTDNTTSAQWNVSGTDIFPRDQAGSVGIGTTNPGARLHIGDGSGDESLRIDAGSTSGTDEAYIGFAQSGSTGMSLGYDPGGSSSTRELVISGGSGITTNQLVTFKQSGNVGLGTTTPSSRLEIVNSSASTSFLELQSSTVRTHILNVTPAGDLVFTNDNGHGTNLVLDSSGDVGIGTSSPSKTFEVSDGTSSFTFDPSARETTLNNTNGKNMTIASSDGSVIIQLG